MFMMILNSMRAMPGIMSQMPPLPIEINKELADAILPSVNEVGSIFFICMI